jgi:hypothetical protein
LRGRELFGFPETEVVGFDASAGPLGLSTAPSCCARPPLLAPEGDLLGGGAPGAAVPPNFPSIRADFGRAKLTEDGIWSKAEVRAVLVLARCCWAALSSASLVAMASAGLVLGRVPSGVGVGGMLCWEIFIAV